MNDNFELSEISNDILYDIVIEANLKDKFIHILSNASSFKSGATNLNNSNR